MPNTHDPLPPSNGPDPSALPTSAPSKPTMRRHERVVAGVAFAMAVAMAATAYLALDPMIAASARDVAWQYAGVVGFASASALAHGFVGVAARKGWSSYLFVAWVAAITAIVTAIIGQASIMALMTVAVADAVLLAFCHELDTRFANPLDTAALGLPRFLDDPPSDPTVSTTSTAETGADKPAPQERSAPTESENSGENKSDGRG